MKPSAAIVMGLLLALLRGGDVLGGDADGPVVVDVPEQAATEPEKGSSIAEIPRAEATPSSEEQPSPDSQDQQGTSYDPLNPPPPPAVPDLHSLREFLDHH